MCVKGCVQSLGVLFLVKEVSSGEGVSVAEEREERVFPRVFFRVCIWCVLRDFWGVVERRKREGRRGHVVYVS